MKARKILVLALGTLLPTGIVASVGGATLAKAADAPSMVEYTFYEHQEGVHQKITINSIPGNIASPSRHVMETNYQQGSVPNLYSEEASLSRIVVNAPTAGTYDYEISTYNATADFPVDIYVNSFDNKITTTLDNTTWWNKDGLQYSKVSLDLQEGLNVIVLQFNKWGPLATFRLPSELELVDLGSDLAGVYAGTDLHYAETYIDNPEESLWDANSALPYSYLRSNSSSSYESAIYVELSPSETTKSLDFTVQVDQANAEGRAALSIQLGLDGPTLDFDFDVPETGIPFTVHMPSNLLEKWGFAGGNPMTLRMSSKDSSQQVRVLSVAESELETADPAASGRIYLAGDKLRSSVKVNGRSLELENGIALDWSGSGLEFDLEGKGDVVANFYLSNNSNNTRFVVEIDGGEPTYVVPTAETYLATDLPEGRHNIRITKTSEANGNLSQLVSLQVDAAAKLTPVAERETKFLFLGASIVCGSQMGKVDGQDYYQAWGNLLTRAYDADSQVISASGRGLIQGTLGESGWTPDNEKEISDIFDRTSYFRDEGSYYDLSSFVPDAIFVNAGNNDLGVLDDFGNTVDDIAKACVDFTGELESLYPEAKIVWLWGVGTNHGKSYGETMRTAIEGMGDENVAFVSADETRDGEVTTGTMIQGLGGHPNKYQHDQIAEMLSAAYSKLANVEDPYARRFDYSRFEAEDYMVGGTLNVEADNAGQNWSGGEYVSSLSNNGVTTADGVEARAANVDHIEIPFEARIGGRYEIQIGYATSDNTTIAYAIDDAPFTALENINSNDWCGGHGVYESIYVDLPKGNHTFYLTGALTGWINLDYVNVVFAGDSHGALLDARGYGDDFMEKTGAECAVSVNTGNFDHDLWLELKDSYEALSPEARDIICSYEEFAALRERYALIASKYGYEAFLNDSNGEHAMVEFVGGIAVEKSEDLPIVISSALLIGAAALAGFAFVKKRKHSA